MYNLFLTGEVRIGKSTILKNVLERVNVSVGGYMTERNTKNHIRTFTAKSLYDGKEKYIIANVNRRDNSKEIFPDTFEIGLTSILENSLKNRDLIVLDELGFMEKDMERFTSNVYEIWDSEKPVLGVLKNYECGILNNIRNREDVIIIQITKENRDTMIFDIIDILLNFGVKFN